MAAGAILSTAARMPAIVAPASSSGGGRVMSAAIGSRAIAGFGAPSRMKAAISNPASERLKTTSGAASASANPIRTRGCAGKRPAAPAEPSSLFVDIKKAAFVTLQRYDAAGERRSPAPKEPRGFVLDLYRRARMYVGPATHPRLDRHHLNRRAHSHGLGAWSAPGDYSFRREWLLPAPAPHRWPQ